MGNNKRMPEKIVCHNRRNEEKMKTKEKMDW
jgi:hypothetical protein